MEAHPHSQTGRCEFALEPSRGCHSVGGAGEHGEEGLALRVHLAPTAVANRARISRWCSVKSSAKAFLPICVRSAVDPSTSVKRNVTVPLGSCPATGGVCQRCNGEIQGPVVA